MLTQWYDIGALIAVTFLVIVVILALAVYLEQRLERPDPPHPVALPEPEPAQQDKSGPEPWAPDLSVQAGAFYLRRITTPGLDPAPQAARLSVHLFTGLPPNTGEQLRQ
jgi:hypothetical protein